MAWNKRKEGRPKRREFGGGSINRTVYDYILEVLPENKTILELGSGWGSGELMQHWNLYSIEHKEAWFKLYNPQSFLVPVTHELGWYDIEILKEALSGLKYDLLLIDGPHYGREHFPANLDLFDTTVLMIFDDVNRSVGQNVIKEVSELVCRPYVIHYPNTKESFGVIEGTQTCP
ncbi:hypothetical protein LCGC14_0209310 [marine sediment metagenome]|uniref:Class I SAM-dependent methyltransferase n=1 Tax=marine sediment metagenome TaxID=412755 RepID=A0A0F9UGU3_9ZZZZ